jgi:hypothetical protein
MQKSKFATHPVFTPQKGKELNPRKLNQKNKGELEVCFFKAVQGSFLYLLFYPNLTILRFF